MTYHSQNIYTLSLLSYWISILNGAKNVIRTYIFHQKTGAPYRNRTGVSTLATSHSTTKLMRHKSEGLMFCISTDWIRTNMHGFHAVRFTIKLRPTEHSPTAKYPSCNVGHCRLYKVELRERCALSYQVYRTSASLSMLTEQKWWSSRESDPRLSVIDRRLYH
jgi:hypothetical protein